MELKEFIKISLVEIADAVIDARKATQGKGIKFAVFNSDKSEDSYAVTKDCNFDIAVTVAENSTSGVGGRIKVFGLDIGGKLADTQDKQSISRLSFSIPITFSESSNQSEVNITKSEDFNQLI